MNKSKLNLIFARHGCKIVKNRQKYARHGQQKSNNKCFNIIVSQIDGLAVH